jgi:hypothetical protein
MKTKARHAAELLAEWVEKERQARLLDTGSPRIAGLVDAWERDRMQFEPWDEGTRKQMRIKMRRIRRALDECAVNQTDRMFLEAWLSSFCARADVFNKWRYALILLWKFAESRKLVDVCEPEMIEPRSTSKKIPSNWRRLDFTHTRADRRAALDGLVRHMMSKSVEAVESTHRGSFCRIRGRLPLWPNLR